MSQRPERFMPRTARRDRFVVAVDYGNTFSNAAVTFKGKPDSYDQIPLIRNFPGNVNSEGVPSLSSYEDRPEPTAVPGRKRKAAGSSTTIPSQAAAKVKDWGFRVDKSKNFIELTKLLLDPYHPLPPWASRDRLQAQIANTGKTAVEVAADFLGLLKNHILQDMKRRYGSVLIENTDIEWILTVPAVWSDTAKDATLRAAKMAGLGASSSLTLVTEPEAAAIYALKVLEDFTLRVGDHHIICDCGGGTVDLISYVAKQLSPLRLEESVTGSGAICGSAMLNLRFEELVEQRMGTEACKKYRETNARGWARCIEEFELRTKRVFDISETDPDYPYYITMPGVPDNPDRGMQGNFLILKAADLMEIFRPIVQQIIDLVYEQYNSLMKKGKKPSSVILVGGFGNNLYLFESLKAHFEDIKDFEVLQPLNAWSAIARGAIIHCIEGEGLVRTRIARRHYGVVTRQVYNAKKHDKSVHKVQDPNDGRWYVDNQIDWYVTKGQALPYADPIVRDFYFTSENEFVQESIMMVVCDDDERPTEFEPTASTRILCTISPDMRAVPADLWIEGDNEKDNTRFMRLDYGIGMKFTGGNILWDMRVDGVVYGTAAADYE
ncbi:actin-like ATPase domain-containing protein, partial [Aureobasidium melanogenum]